MPQSAAPALRENRVTAKVLILNGPGLADSGTGITLDELERACADSCADVGLAMEFRHTDDENRLLAWLAGDSAGFDGIIVNPGPSARCAMTSRASYVAAIAGLKTPLIEVHLHNIYKDTNAAADGSRQIGGDIGLVCGFGTSGYRLALQSMARKTARPIVREST